MDRTALRAASPRVRWLVVALVAGAIFVGSVVPVPGGQVTVSGPLGLVGADKWLHALAYATLAAALLVALDDGDRSTLLALAVAVAACVAFGYGIELLQGALGYRDYDLLDLAADAVGTLLAAGLWVVLTSRGSQPRRPPG